MLEAAAPSRRLLRLLALVLGPLAYALILRTASDALGPDQREVLGVGAWMLIWWLSEPVPLAVTSLLPVILLPIHGVLSIRDITAPYANEMILLFLAGFLIAAALEHWGAHTRLALGIVDRVGRSGRGIVLGFMTATALLSMFISNTATAAMMYPIALAVGQLFGEGRDADKLRTALLLGLAYAASIGGMGTLLGTPPNLILAASARELLGEPLDFARYLLVGLPCVLVLLPLCWALLVHVFFRAEVRLGDAATATIHERHGILGRIRGGEAGVLAIFGLTALAWLARQPKTLGSLQLPGLETQWPGLSDASIGLAGALLLFVFRAKDVDGTSRPLLTWHEAKAIPWDVLLLFGGGLSLAAAMETTGVTLWFGQQLRVLEGLSPIVILLGLAFATVLLSEFASNTAVAAMAMPVAAGLAGAVNLPPLTLMAVAALAASAGFALPIATPPNAIAYGSGRVRSRDMLVAGLALDVVAVLVIVAVVSLTGFGR
jgi:sodium-dependent dicarboxylate transporter 2/3/5